MFYTSEAKYVHREHASSFKNNSSCWGEINLIFNIFVATPLSSLPPSPSALSSAQVEPAGIAQDIISKILGVLGFDEQ